MYIHAHTHTHTHKSANACVSEEHNQVPKDFQDVLREEGFKQRFSQVRSACALVAPEAQSSINQFETPGSSTKKQPPPCPGHFFKLIFLERVMNAPILFGVTVLNCNSSQGGCAVVQLASCIYILHFRVDGDGSFTPTCIYSLHSCVDGDGSLTPTCIYSLHFCVGGEGLTHPDLHLQPVPACSGSAAPSFVANRGTKSLWDCFLFQVQLRWRAHQREPNPSRCKWSAAGHMRASDFLPIKMAPGKSKCNSKQRQSLQAI
eukprot:1157994-Pelagomonas_calceolata.AAC.4